MRKIDKIILHCSATEAGKNFKAKDIDQWHKQRGFRKIGYHYVILLDGTVEVGRNMHEYGAHCIGQNYTSIGICYIGGLKDGKPFDTRTDNQKVAMKRLLMQLRDELGNISIHGHYEYAKKACPCFDVKEYSNI